MLQRLEAADRHAELLAVLQVLHRAFERLGGAAQHFGGEPGAGAVEHAVQQIGAAVHRAQHRFRRRRARPSSRICAALRLSTMMVRVRLTPGASPGTRNSVMPSSLVAPAGGPRRDDQHVGDMAVQHEGLLAVQHVAAAVRAPRWWRCGAARGAAPPPAPGRTAARPQPGAANAPPSAPRCRPASSSDGAEQRRGQQRRGGQRAARRLHHLRQPGHAEAGAAMFLRHQEAGPAEFRHLPPQRAGETVRVVAVAQFAQRGDRAAFAEERHARCRAPSGLRPTGSGHRQGPSRAISPAAPARAWQ